jgi:hypothetical protein
MINGDVGCLLRVFNFLKKEKIINCQVKKESKNRKNQKRSFMEAFEFPVRRFGDLSEEIEGNGRLQRIKKRVRKFLYNKVKKDLPECGVCEEIVSLRWFSFKDPKGRI